ncbi:hypothetical protein LIER_06205 [Lithospermum erythrorhizon]|uniref:Uncharacterized protein n=1 Tax=Lithospermum erythrorhizon TaxID=34254 RepID=A0AAV3P4Z6_LITER
MVNCVSRIIVSWNPNNVSVQLVCSSEQHILLRVQDLIHNKGPFFFTTIYGKHIPADRRILWSSLADDVYRINGDPWLIGIRSLHVDMSIICNNPSDPKPFKYNHFLTTHESFLSIIEDVWNENVEGNYFQKLQHYCKSVKNALKNLNKQAFSNISARVVEMKQKIEEIQELVLQEDVSSETLCKAKDITMKYNVLCKAEIEFYRNKAMMAWYKDGDDSTRLFHSSMRINQRKSLITQIHNEEGVLITDYQQVQVVTIEFYKKSSLHKPR